MKLERLEFLIFNFIHVRISLVKCDYFYLTNRWELCISLIPNHDQDQLLLHSSSMQRHSGYNSFAKVSSGFNSFIWRRSLSYLLCKSMDWFLYDRDLRHKELMASCQTCKFGQEWNSSRQYSLIEWDSLTLICIKRVPGDLSTIFMATIFTQKISESSGSTHSSILMLENIWYHHFTWNGSNSQEIVNLF